MLTVENINAKKSSDSCIVQFSDGNTYSLSYDIVLKYSITKNKVLSEEIFKEILKLQNIIDAKKTAFNYISYKPRSEKQVRTKLKEKNYDDEIIKLTIQFLKEFSYINDNELIIRLAKSYLARNNVGLQKLKMELYERGFEKFLIEDAINEISKDYDEYEVAKLAADKKMKMLYNKLPEKAKRSLYAYLLRQGFTYDSINEVIKEIF